MSPDIGGLTAHFLRAVDPAEMVTHVERVSERDRYQASRGIEEAAALVAEAAQAAGLEDVALDRFPADGRTHWWSFRAPRSWTPIRARLEVGGSDPRAVVIDHGRQLFSVATHSAGTPPDGIAARLVVVHDAGGLELVSGAIAIVPRASFREGRWRRGSPAQALSASRPTGRAAWTRPDVNSRVVSSSSRTRASSHSA